MGFHSISPKVTRLVLNLMREYDIDSNIRMLPMKSLNLFGDAQTVGDMVANAVLTLENLGPGTWETYDHPGMLIEGEEKHWNAGAEWDADYRDAVTKVLVSEELQEVIERRDIKRIGYKDLQFWH